MVEINTQKDKIKKIKDGVIYIISIIIILLIWLSLVYKFYQFCNGTSDIKSVPLNILLFIMIITPFLTVWAERQDNKRKNNINRVNAVL